MALLNCFSTFGAKKKKVKGDGKASPDMKKFNGLRTIQVKLEQQAESSENGDGLNSTSLTIPVPFDISEGPTCEVKIMKPESPVEKEEEEAVEVAYEGEDERDDKLSMKRDNSDFNLQIHDTDSGKLEFQFVNTDLDSNYAEDTNNGATNLIEFESGHVSDPGMVREELMASPKLKRSCSSLDTREVLKKMGDKIIPPPSKSQSYEQLQELAQKVEEDVLLRSPCSHVSALSRRSADKVMLKKHSSSQILPSRSRRLWWKLFLWSHRNLQKPKTRVSHLVSLNQQGGYSSDTLEAGRVILESPVSFSEICSAEKDDGNEQKWEGFKTGVSGLWPQNQWVAFPGESSPLKRVEDWVKDLDVQSTTSSIEGENGNYEEVNFPPSPEASGSVVKVKGATHLSRHDNNNRMSLSEELLHANSIIQSLNSSSTVAHISGMGLKAIPLISQFSSLRTVNLSNNSIAQITPGSLPKGLHVLDLSRNKISTIEGLRELTRLRVLDLSYNRISRIGHGLANCTLLKELYLAGNKISEVEGLHRLLKLTVLDVSFNKITTTKALGQLVANYNSLLALNLLGNPIQNNLGEEQLRKAVCGLVPKLAYLNKQPVNQQRAREVPMDIVAKASSRNSSKSVHRRSVKKVSQSRGLRSNASVVQRNRVKMMDRSNHHSPLKRET